MSWPWGWVVVISCIGVWILILAGAGYFLFREISEYLLEEVKLKKTGE